MTDWTGEGRATAEIYQSMADVDFDVITPSYAALCRAVARSHEVCALLDRVPSQKRQPNLLLASVRYLGGPVDDSSAFLQFVLARWPDLEHIILSHRTQTNEPARLATLLPVLASLSEPLALIEIGASAGLCLFPDRYSYHYRTESGEHHLGSSSVVFRCAVTGSAPLPERLPTIGWRAGIDLNPLHTDRAEDRRWLASLVWPEQTDRAEHLERAMDLVSPDPPRLIAGDATSELPGLLAEVPDGMSIVVFHSAVLAYFTSPQREQFTRLVHELQAERSVHWVSNEAVGIVDGTDIGSRAAGGFVVAHNQIPVAIAGSHGQTLDWL